MVIDYELLRHGEQDIILLLWTKLGLGSFDAQDACRAYVQEAKDIALRRAELKKRLDDFEVLQNRSLLT